MKREWKDLTQAQRKGVEVLARAGRPLTAREVLIGMGEKKVDRAMVANYRRILVRLEQYGVLSRPDPGLFQFVPGCLESSAALQMGSTDEAPAAPSKSLVVDPWGHEVTEADVRRVIAEAVKYYLKDLRKRRKHEEADRVAFLCGAYLTGRPMPHAVAPIVQTVAPSAPAEPHHAPEAPPDTSGAFVRLPLPQGWTTETYLQKAKSALSKGLLDATSLAAKMNLGSDYVEKVLRGKIEPTREMIERFFAATYEVLLSL